MATFVLTRSKPSEPPLSFLTDSCSGTDLCGGNKSSCPFPRNVGSGGPPVRALPAGGARNWKFKQRRTALLQREDGPRLPRHRHRQASSAKVNVAGLMCRGGVTAGPGASAGLLPLWLQAKAAFSALCSGFCTNSSCCSLALIRRPGR